MIKVCICINEELAHTKRINCTNKKHIMYLIAGFERLEINENSWRERHNGYSTQLLLIRPVK
jgi:hypothetical protein